jgi:hypothetical protein
MPFENDGNSRRKLGKTKLVQWDYWRKQKFKEKNWLILRKNSCNIDWK